jgi:hypothetical protein
VDDVVAAALFRAVGPYVREWAPPAIAAEIQAESVVTASAFPAVTVAPPPETAPLARTRQIVRKPQPKPAPKVPKPAAKPAAKPTPKGRQKKAK